eukprot:TRINITY_DN7357_c0_g1_i2.p1 TRINITY_DN7357_c0_g1~~TRINITY_DN7357_c0_g1_i2.p1  ORF type:complete len:135 (-),score=15.84 TRINITY_DN7357_c0_g1_i2:12-416(-)
MCASTEGHPDIIKLLLTCKPSPDLDIQDRFGWTALMWACENENRKCAQLLLNHNPPPNIDIQDEDGWTALLCAADDGYSKIVRLLLKDNPPPDLDLAENEFGNTPPSGSSLEWTHKSSCPITFPHICTRHKSNE